MIDWTDAAATVAAALRARGIESDLADADLKAFATAAVDEIAARGFGPQTDVTLHVDSWGQRFITLSPPAASVTSVTEEGTLLAADDDGYRVRPGGLFLERLSGGYPIGWRGRVVIIYDALTATERYDRVVVDLVKLALEFSGLASRADGDYREQGQPDYQAERERLIDELAPAGVGFA